MYLWALDLYETNTKMLMTDGPGDGMNEFSNKSLFIYMY